MSLYRRSRKYHKWLMLVVGLQFMVWSVSGLYMVVMDIHYIHGNSLVANTEQPIDTSQVSYSFAELLSAYPQATNVELAKLLDQVIYRFYDNKQAMMISASDGSLLAPINQTQAIGIAKRHYVNRQANISGTTLLTDIAPRELSPRHLPVWRVDFDDSANPSFFISVNSGKLVTKRHRYWRIFDWMFAFHVMDYIDEAVDNRLLFVFIVLSLLASLCGVVLTYVKLVKPLKDQRTKTTKSISQGASYDNA